MLRHFDFSFYGSSMWLVLTKVSFTKIMTFFTIWHLQLGMTKIYWGEISWHLGTRYNFPRNHLDMRPGQILVVVKRVPGLSLLNHSLASTRACQEFANSLIGYKLLCCWWECSGLQCYYHKGLMLSLRNPQKRKEIGGQVGLGVGQERKGDD